MKVFDFDKTLSLKDTTLDFFCHGLGSTQRTFCIMYYYILATCVKFHMIEVYRLKSILLKWRFKHIDAFTWENHCKEFAYTIVTNGLFKKTNWAEENLVIASASFQEVLQHLFPPNVKIMGTLTALKNGTVLITDHLYRDRKRQALEENGIYSIDEFYTDSWHDRPLMKMAKENFWVEGDRVTLLKTMH